MTTTLRPPTLPLALGSLFLLLLLLLAACAPAQRILDPGPRTPQRYLASPSEVLVAIGEIAPNLDSRWDGFGRYRVGTVGSGSITLLADDDTPGPDGEVEATRELYCSASAREGVTTLVCDPDDPDLLKFLAGRFETAPEDAGAATGM